MQNKDIHRIFEDKVDKLVFDKLSNQETIAIDHEWELLSNRLNNHKKLNQRKKFFTAIAFTLLLSASLYFFLTTHSKNELKNQLINQNASKMNEPLDGNSSIQNNNLTTQHTTSNQTSLTPTLNNTTLTHPITHTPHNSIQTNNNQLITNQNASPTKVLNNQFFKKQKIKQSKVFLSTKDQNVLSEDIALTPQKSNESNSLETQNENTGEEKAEISNTEKQDLNTETVKTPIADVAIITAPKPVPELKKYKKSRNMPTHYFEDSKSWYIEAFSGMTSSKKNENSFAAFLAPAGYNTMRLQQENSLNSMTLGVNVKLRQKHLTISSGLQYVQLGDRINYDTSFNNNSLVFSANGKTQFSYVEIPILAGYEWASKRWGFNFQAGISTGILSRLSGQYVSIQNFNSQLFNIAENQQTFRNTVFNLLVNPQVAYYLNDNSNVFVTPSYRRNLQPITITGSDLTQKYSIWGIQFGVRTRIK